MVGAPCAGAEVAGALAGASSASVAVELAPFPVVEATRNGPGSRCILVAESALIGAGNCSTSASKTGATAACVTGAVAALCLMLGVEPQLLGPNGEIEGAAAGADTADERGVLATGLEAERDALCAGADRAP